jgi:large subunit ribosomal protein LP0
LGTQATQARRNMSPAKTSATRSYPEKKVKYFQTMNRLLTENNKIMIVGVDNVQAQQLHDVRISLRGRGSVLMGKNTMMKKVLTDRALSGNERDKTLLAKLGGLLQGNIGLVFTNGDLSKMADEIEREKVQAGAKQGSVAPCDVIIPAGVTGLEPTKTQFFQSLNINTKITKGSVEILKDEQIVTKGNKITSSQAALLGMLGIKPFWYGLVIQNVYDNGSVYGADILKLTDEQLRLKVGNGIANLAAFSLATGFTTKASFPHLVVNAFKDFLAVAVTTSYEFSEFNGAQLKQRILNPVAAPAAAAPAAAAAASAKGPAAPAPKDEEEEEASAFGLFD